MKERWREREARGGGGDIPRTRGRKRAARRGKRIARSIVAGS